MILITSLLIGYAAALLRSVAALVVVAFLMTMTYLVSLFLYSSPLVNLFVSIAGFNIGLVMCASVFVIRASWLARTGEVQ